MNRSPRRVSSSTGRWPKSRLSAWHELNRDPGDRHVYYQYSWQEVMERHGHVSNQRNFAFHRGVLRKVQNRIIECQRSVAERMESVRRSMRRIGREGADTNVGAWALSHSCSRLHQARSWAPLCMTNVRLRCSNGSFLDPSSDMPIDDL